MGLATIDPHSHEVETKFYKIPKFGVNRPNSKKDTAIWKCQSLQRNVWPSGRCPTKRPEAMHFFVNFEVFKSLYLSKNLPDKLQTWGFCESRCALSDYVDQLLLIP